MVDEKKNAADDLSDYADNAFEDDDDKDDDWDVDFGDNDLGGKKKEMKKTEVGAKREVKPDSNKLKEPDSAEN